MISLRFLALAAALSGAAASRVNPPRVFLGPKGDEDDTLDEFNPESNAYWYSIGALAMPGAILAVLLILFLLARIFYKALQRCCRMCCSCCEKAARGEDKERLRKARTYFFASFVIIVISAGLGYAGSGLFHVGMNEFMDESEAFADDMFADAQIVDEYVHEGYALLGDPVPDSLEDTLDDIEYYRNEYEKFKNGEGDPNQDTVDEWEAAREAVLYCILSLNVLAAFLGVVGVCIKKKWVVSVSVYTGFLGVILIWVLFAIILPFAVVAGDSCYVVENIDDPAVQTIDGEVDSFRKYILCDTEDSPYQELTDDIIAEINVAIQEANDEIDTLNAQLDACPLTDETVRYLSYDADDENVWIVSRDNVLADVEAVPDDACGFDTTETKDLVKEQYVPAGNYLVDASYIMLDQVDCATINSFVDAIAGSTCDEMLDGSNLMLAGVLMMGIMMTFGNIFLGIRGVGIGSGDEMDEFGGEYGGVSVA
eukprot:Rmarinus@m.15442